MIAAQAVLLVIGLGNAAFGAEAMTIDQVLGEIERAESKIADISAKFRQETKLPGTGERQVITGTFEIMKNPERFRIRYTSPVEQMASFDGEWLTLYFPETAQAFRQKTTLADISRMIGIDPSAPTRNMRDNFDGRLGDCGEKSCKIVFSIKGGRRGERAKGRDLIWNVEVDSKTWMVKEAEMVSDEIEMKIKVFQYRANLGIEPDSLRLDMPAGTEIFDGIPQLFAPGVREGTGK